MLQMAIVLTYGAKVPVIKVGRMAGQFAKPRSAPTEVKDGVELPSYRGDIINELDFTSEARFPNPSKMLQAYTQAAATLNLLRAFSTGGFADMSRVHAWTLGFTDDQDVQKYSEIADRIQDSIDFMDAAGINADTTHEFSSVEFYSNGALIGTDNSSPFSITWTIPSTGNYTLTALAYDNDGDSGSDVVAVTCGTTFNFSKRINTGTDDVEE